MKNLIALFLLFFAMPAFAQVTNYGFENGNYTGWNTSYSMNVTYVTYAGVVTNLTVNAGAKWTYGAEITTVNKTNLNLELLAPNLAQYTGLTNSYLGGSGAGTGAGLHQIASAFTGFTLSTASNFTGGTITVYAYRKA